MKNLLTTFCFVLICFFTSYGQSAPSSNNDYIIQDSVLITTRDGANVSALIVRKKAVTQPQATILVFTIYARTTDIKRAREAADKGYVGVVAYTRGKKNSTGEIIPYEKDGDDVNDVIDWIIKQSWSDKRVAMYGGSYNGFTQWAATKHLHPALKTIVPSASAAPGIDSPMMNNVFMEFPFSWTYYVTNNKWLDTTDYNSRKWFDLSIKWYEEGVSFRSRDSLLGRTANKYFRKWLDHPTYDTYWQSMIPYKNDFARINIPVLSTTGYYDGGQVGALYFLREHYKYNPKAEHYLLIGPYGHFGSQGSPEANYKGYQIDSVANISIKNVIYEWFDYVLKGGKKPEILKEKINYQVMGANTWKHSTTLKGVSNDTLRFYFANLPKGEDFTLSKQKPKTKGAVLQEVDFKDREGRNSYFYANEIIYDTLYSSGKVYISEPLEQDMELNGAFTGVIKAIVNKKDMDYSLVLFEQTPKGDYFYLSYFMGRASHTTDNIQRKLLTPGKISVLPFSNTYMTSKKLQKGSKIVMVLNINKSPFEQINYGTGKDVSAETIKDSGEPIRIEWQNDSYVNIPVWRQK
ncbi:MAG TPA: CocE/NonD family hydrolase [Emticicia sp.]